MNSICFSILLSFCFFGLVIGGGQSFFWEKTLNATSSTLNFTSFVLPLLSEPLSLSIFPSLPSTLVEFCICNNRKPNSVVSKWPTQCLFHIQAKNLTKATLDLVPSVYWIGLSSASVQEVSISLKSFECLDGFWGKNCSLPPTFHLLTPGEEANFNFSASSPTIFGRFVAPSRISTLIFNFSYVSTSPSLKTRNLIDPGSTALQPLFTSIPPPTANFTLSLRHGNFPMANVTDFSSIVFIPLTSLRNSSASFSLPQPGDWFFSLTLVSSPESSFQLIAAEDSEEEKASRLDVGTSWSSRSCKKNRAGDLCQFVTRFNSSNSNQILERATPNQEWEYFLFSSPSLSQGEDAPSFNFSVQSVDGSLHFPPDVYLGFNQVPTLSQYEAKRSRSLVNSFQIDSPTAGNWYFAVRGNGRSYVVWFNGQCPGGCNGKDCIKDGDFYRCSCPHAFDLYNCAQNQDGMKPAVFASILVAYAVVMTLVFASLIYICNRNRESTQGYIRIDQENIVS